MIPVVIAFTSNYLVPAATLIHSVLRNTSSDVEFICLTCEALSSEHKQMLENLSCGRSEFKYLDLVSLPDGVYVDSRYSAAAEYRLLLPELLPDYEKVLYIDCDIIVRNDVSEVFNTILTEDCLLGVVFERESYFNSGFLLMNLARMREENTSVRLLECLKTDYLEFPDQDALNIVCAGRVKAFPPYCNSIRTFWLPQYKDEFLKIYSEDDYSDMIAKGNIHYTGGKPWNILTVRFGDWWEEYSLLPNAIMEQWTPSAKIRIISKLYSNGHIGKCIDCIRSVYRKIRYKV